MSSVAEFEYGMWKKDGLCKGQEERPKIESRGNVRGPSLWLASAQ